MPLPAGTRVGAFEVLAKLGEGGMGEVYRARDHKLNRDVALKVLPTSFAGDAERLLRFRREAQVLASLNHPNIAHIYGFEDSPVAGGGAAIHALVMELIDGPTVADVIRAQGALPIEQVLTIGRQLCEAIEAAHDQGIVHRDLKPANIKINPEGNVKVLDFGLAKALAPGGASNTADAMNSPTLTGRVTEAGLILGTAAYMAPEQARGLLVDRRADIWAFGVIVYEMLTGNRPFSGADVTETLAAVLRDTPAFDALPVTTPSRLRRIIEKCLVRNPKQRLRDIGDARIELDAIAVGQTDDIVPSTARVAASPAFLRLLPWLIAGAAVVIASVLLGWTTMHSAPESMRAVQRFKTTIKAQAGFISVSRDGSQLVYASELNQGGNLVGRPLDQIGDRKLPGSDHVIFPVLSPDGRWVAGTTADGHLVRLPITGGAASPIADGGFAEGADWGNDDTIVFSGPKGLLRVPATGGTPQPITTLGSNERAHVRPQFLPGGHRVLFLIVPASAAAAMQFAVLDLDTGHYRVVAQGGPAGKYVPTGHLVFLRESTLYATPFDVNRLEVTGPETPIVEDVSVAGPSGTGDYAFSDTGLLVYFQQHLVTDPTLAWADRNGVAEVLPGPEPLAYGTQRLSPDGMKIATGIRRGETTELGVTEIGKTNLTMVTNDGDNNRPVWSSDGRRLYFGAALDGKYGIWCAAADASSKPTLVIPTNGLPKVTSITRDGQTLLYYLTAGNGGTIFALEHLSGSPMARPLHPDARGYEVNAVLSPDERWVAYESFDTGRREIFIQPFPGPGQKTPVSAKGGKWPFWAHSGRELFYWSSTNLMSAPVESTASSVRVGTLQPLFSLQAGLPWDVAPKDDRFLVEIVDSTFLTESSYVVVTNWFDELRRLAKPKAK